MGNVLTVPTQNSEGSLFSIGNMVFQIALKGGGGFPHWGDSRNFAGGIFLLGVGMGGWDCTFDLSRLF